MTKIKDPVYGYIELDDYILDIIDTPCFQRLRNITQTSYAPVYPTSVHNRFSHSLGVYFLGKKAINALFSNFEIRYPDVNLAKKFIDKIKHLFLLACILHDIGHAPFSHTGEKFYLEEKVKNGTEPKLIDDLNKLLDDEYALDRKYQIFCKPKAHEFMSAFLGVKKYLARRSKEDKSFFVRCIIGLQYYNCNSFETQLKNACIELLNSSTIDVDKLDYIIRDSYMTGFYSIEIDYERLLSNISFNALEDNQKNNIIEKVEGDKRSSVRHVFIAFKKQALSVLENVIIANDLERKWIQAHPKILYNDFLLRVIIQNLIKNISKKNKYPFSYKTLIDDGRKFDGYTLRYLSDDDVIFIAKNIYYDEWAKEYYDRKLWRHPLWKSQAEFKVLNKDLGESGMQKLMEIIKDIEVDILEGKYNTNKIGNSLLNEYIKEYDKASKLLKTTENESSKKTVITKQEKLGKKLKFLQFIKEYCDDNDTQFDFVLRTSKLFTSGLSKNDFRNIVVQFDSLGQSTILQNAITIGEYEILDDDYFYLYQKRGNNQVDAVDFCKRMGAFAITI